jgi:hypothetical protein
MPLYECPSYMNVILIFTYTFILISFLYLGKGHIPTDNKYNVTATFHVDLQNIHNDYGAIEVTVGSKHKYYKVL